MSLERMNTSALEIKDELSGEFSWDFKIPPRTRINQNMSQFGNGGFVFPDLKFSTGFLAHVDHKLSFAIYANQVNAFLQLPIQHNKKLELRTATLEFFSSPFRLPGPRQELRFVYDLIHCEENVYTRYAGIWTNDDASWDDAVHMIRLNLSVVCRERGEVIPYANEDIANKFLVGAEEAVRLGGFDDMFLSGDLSDVMLVCGDNAEFPAHRFLLSGKSPVFRKMFQDEGKGAKEGRIILEDISAPALKEFLRFLYCGRVLRWGNPLFQELFKFAEKFEVQMLKNVCERNLIDGLGVNNAAEMYRLGEMHNGVVLQEQALKIIAKNKGGIFPDASTLKQFSDRYPEIIFELLKS
ncbi:BTB/POZ domain-containing protein At1g55760-like [Folsomia candida]|uniref:Speckle-type POZ protein n=1 Tax=Folsomia candida TaxID=158441 RepID=A0A226E910_FOLCA|nr:BTB/POZ domain-containing protein At1g55760-like [Folsomia candida]OXA53351.1 Speckle-type POZ protein [Folsomia candida]